jgi:lysophospholipase L1-like esterase
MNYLALGDSISIDDYTEVVGGGAASQFAGLLDAAHFQDLTRDGRTTDGVLEVLSQVTVSPDVITLTAGGNDFLQNAFRIADPHGSPGGSWEAVTGPPVANLKRIAGRLAAFGCPVIINTIYDPTDGDDALIASFGVGPGARDAYNILNDGIRGIARENGFLLSDLQELFRGHGAVAADTWIVGQIEPNYAGATAIAKHWYALYQRQIGHG